MCETCYTCAGAKLWTFEERTPEIGEIIFLDTAANFPRHTALYLISEPWKKLPEMDWLGFGFLANVIQVFEGVATKTPLNVKGGEMYWVYNASD